MLSHDRGYNLNYLLSTTEPHPSERTGTELREPPQGSSAARGHLPWAGGHQLFLKGTPAYRAPVLRGSLSPRDRLVVLF